jgi:integrase
MHRYQRGWIEVEGARGRKRYVGRYRADDGVKPKVVLGLLSELTLSAARTKLEAHVRQLGSRPTSAAHMTFKEFWDLHYVPRHKVRWGAPTEKGYAGYIRAYLGPAFGNVRLTDIDPQMVATFFDRIRKDHSRSVTRKLWVMLKAVLESAVDDDFIFKNPMRKVPAPKTKIPSKPTMEKTLLLRVLDEVDENVFASAVLHVGAFCAVRPAELFGLRWRSLCQDHLLIRDSAWEGKLLEDATKTGERRVAIPPRTHAAILRWRAQCKDTSPEALIFASAKGTPVSTHNFRNRVLVPLQEKLGLTVPLTFQVLRRSHATRNQKTPKDAQAHLGHKSIVTTLDTYTVEIPASVKQMVRADEAAIFARKKTAAPKLPPSLKARNR